MVWYGIDCKVVQIATETTDYSSTGPQVYSALSLSPIPIDENKHDHLPNFCKTVLTKKTG